MSLYLSLFLSLSLALSPSLSLCPCVAVFVPVSLLPLCTGWFDDWSCCAIDVAANHYVPSELVRSEIQHSSNDMLHLVAELTTVVDDVNNAFERLAIFTSCRKTFIWLNDIREYLEFDVTLPITDYTRRSMTVADALCLICSRRFPQLRSANKTMNVEPVKKSDSNLEGIFDSV